MKKRNLFICFIFAILMCFPLGFSHTQKKAFAEDSTITITFNVNKDLYESCDTESLVINPGETLSSIPVATKRGFIFIGWLKETEKIDETTTFSEDTTLTPWFEEKIYKYTISKPDSYYTIVGQTTSTPNPYTLSSTCESIENAISLISTDSITKNDEDIVNIRFNDISLTEDLNLSFEHVEITGTINISNYSIVFNPTSGTSIINLTDLTLNSTSSQDFVKIAGTNGSTVTITNTTFESTENNDNYSIKLENPIHLLKFNKNLSFTSKYLYNYEISDGNAVFQRKATFDVDFVLVKPTVIPITIPYNADGNSILTTFVGSANMFEVFPNQSNFTCSVNSQMNGRNLVVTTKFDLVFDSNDGNIIEPFTTTNLNYNLYSQLNYPTSTNYSKPHSTLAGFVAKFNDGSNTWYFDQTALDNFKKDTSSPTYSEYFYSEIPNTTLLCFSYYKYNSAKTDLNFLAVDFMLSIGKTPEFVAVWKDTIYTINFNENEGSDLSDMSGIFGSTVTLPTPIRTGYDFIGWFETHEAATEANTNNKVLLTTMPDTNPTLYAGWKIRTHTLSVQQNNQTAVKTIPVVFGTTIESINEANKDLISKTGYTFIGWYTNEELTNVLMENATMPDEDFVIYAKWQINQYTITLFYNHPSIEADDEPFKTITKNYNSDVSTFLNTAPIIPSFVGYEFNRWTTDPEGRFAAILPETMPANNLNLYASWTHHEHKLTIYYLAIGSVSEDYLYFDETLSLPTPTYQGFFFEGWFKDEALTEPFTLTTMPDNNLSVYAKLTAKPTLNLTFDSQSYSISKNNGYKLPENLEGFTVEYFVNEKWTTIVPTKKGNYNIRISKPETNSHKAFVQVVENAFTITPNSVDLQIYIVILYCIAGFEFICAIIILFIKKQRATYLNYAIALPFGLVQTTQFINLIISSILTVVGLVLIIMQIVKLKHINNEIAKISTENKEYTPPDVSENKSISQNVESLLKKEGFSIPTREQIKDYDNDEDEPEILWPEKPSKKETDNSVEENLDDDFESFDSLLNEEDDDIKN